MNMTTKQISAIIKRLGGKWQASIVDGAEVVGAGVGDSLESSLRDALSDYRGDETECPVCLGDRRFDGAPGSDDSSTCDLCAGEGHMPDYAIADAIEAGFAFDGLFLSKAQSYRAKAAAYERAASYYERQAEGAEAREHAEIKPAKSLLEATFDAMRPVRS